MCFPVTTVNIFVIWTFNIKKILWLSLETYEQKDFQLDEVIR